MSRLCTERSFRHGSHAACMFLQHSKISQFPSSYLSSYPRNSTVSFSQVPILWNSVCKCAGHQSLKSMRAYLCNFCASDQNRFLRRHNSCSLLWSLRRFSSGCYRRRSLLGFDCALGHCCCCASTSWRCSREEDVGSTRHRNFFLDASKLNGAWHCMWLDSARLCLRFCSNTIRHNEDISHRILNFTQTSCSILIRPTSPHWCYQWWRASRSKKNKILTPVLFILCYVNAETLTTSIFPTAVSYIKCVVLNKTIHGKVTICQHWKQVHRNRFVKQKITKLYDSMRQQSGLN